MTLNIMMDPSPMYPDMYHPQTSVKKRDASGRAKYYSRTVRPVTYYITDFGLSRHYPAENSNPLEVPIWGGDRTVPEFVKDIHSPWNPFYADIYCMGNLIREDFLAVR